MRLSHGLHVLNDVLVCTLLAVEGQDVWLCDGVQETGQQNYQLIAPDHALHHANPTSKCNDSRHCVVKAVAVCNPEHEGSRYGAV